jgi:hypothetical protein
VADSELNRAELDTALIAAHEADDMPRLATLYTSAADTAEANGDVDACCFYLTHAYVFALASAAPEANRLHARLLKYGREE